MTLDWPAGWERTPSAERQTGRKFQASVADTTTEIEAEMRRMDVDSWRASIGNQHTKSDGLPRHNAHPDDPGFVLRWTDGEEQYAVACDTYYSLRANVRAVYLWVHETRMRGQRPVRTGDSEFAAARLPAGDDAAVAHQRPPHEVLEVSPDATDAVVDAAYRELLKERHPDQGGSTEAVKELRAAKDAMLNGEAES